MVKEIPLTQGKVALVDDEDYEWLCVYKWYLNSTNKVQYAVHSMTNTQNNSRFTVLMHRLILNPDKDMCVDHINHNTLDNRKENLRICAKAQNCQNRKLNKNNKCGYKGVSYCKSTSNSKSYRSYINFNKTRVHIGVFDTPEEAAFAYDQKAKELYGEFAYLNFPEDET